jgi:hypothetical protein
MNTDTSVQGRPAFSANWVNVIFGIWVAVSPFALAFTALPAATWNAVIVGLLIAILALSRSPVNQSVSFLNILLGLWLIASPFVLGIAASMVFWNSIIFGALIVISAFFAGDVPYRARPTPPVA